MFSKLKDSLYALVATIMVFTWTNPVLAGEDPVITSVGSGNEFATKLHEVVTTYCTPLGGVICLIAVLFGGYKILMGAYSPEKRKEAMGGLGYVLLGAILIGGSMFFAGIFMGMSEKFTTGIILTMVVG